MRLGHDHTRTARLRQRLCRRVVASARFAEVRPWEYASGIDPSAIPASNPATAVNARSAGSTRVVVVVLHTRVTMPHLADRMAVRADRTARARDRCIQKAAEPANATRVAKRGKKMGGLGVEAGHLAVRGPTQRARARPVHRTEGCRAHDFVELLPLAAPIIVH